tara:strand:- start:810 stop:1604 length:795 start_codon:yes stop_codon:yes gene_type:complete
MGLKKASSISGKIFKIIGPLFRSKKIIYSNIKKAIPDLSNEDMKILENTMWENYGRILSEYVFLKDFRNDKLNNLIKIEGLNVIEDIKKKGKPVIFISGHFSNFELMAMYIEKSGIDVAAVYRPLNNFFLNKTMVKIRKNYICKKQIKKGISGTKDLLQNFKKGVSIALMIDQRVSEGIVSKFFNSDALTTTIPAQFVKKFNCEIIPVYIERKNEIEFVIKFQNPLIFEKNDSIEKITLNLNHVLEKMITTNPPQWIWTHNRWK